MPDAYADLGAMLREPRDIVFDAQLAHGTELAPFLRGLLGAGYRDQMRASSLVGRWRHMKDQLDHLFWLN